MVVEDWVDEGEVDEVERGKSKMVGTLKDHLSSIYKHRSGCHSLWWILSCCSYPVCGNVPIQYTCSIGQLLH